MFNLNDKAPLDNKGQRTSTISLRSPSELYISSVLKPTAVYVPPLPKTTAVVKMEVEAWERRKVASELAKKDIEKACGEKELKEVGMFDEMDSTRIVRSILGIN